MRTFVVGLLLPTRVAGGGARFGVGWKHRLLCDVSHGGVVNAASRQGVTLG